MQSIHLLHWPQDELHGVDLRQECLHFRVQQLIVVKEFFISGPPPSHHLFFRYVVMYTKKTMEARMHWAL